MSTNYGFVLIGLGVASILSSQIAGYYKNIASQNIELMSPAFVIAAICAIVGIALILIVKKIAGRLDQTQL
jgi:OFA family oxalate/formate antiporter-like MFS transporter